MRILVIEDNEDNMELIDFLLTHAGHQTCKVDNGEQALQKISGESYDLLICDIQLPGMDGQQTLEAIRKLPNGKRLASIAMTSYAMSGDREKLLASGFNGYIEKPFDPEKVISQIKQIWSQFHENSDC